jgi:hypothetical protein
MPRALHARYISTVVSCFVHREIIKKSETQIRAAAKNLIGSQIKFLIARKPKIPAQVNPTRFLLATKNSNGRFAHKFV